MALKKKIGIALDPELHAKVKSMAPLRGMNIEKVYETAIRAWLNEPTNPEPQPRSYLEENLILHDKLERILNSGDVGTIRAVVPNIEVFHERLKPGRSSGRVAVVETLEPEEARIVEEYRKSSYEKRRRILGFAATAEDLSPEVMPSRKRASGKS